MSSSVSLVISLSLCVVIFGGMQMFKAEIASNEWKTIGGGFLGSWLFVFALTVSMLCYIQYMDTVPPFSLLSDTLERILY